MMKSQGLPMQTIVLIVIIVVTMAVVIMFFYTSFNKSKQPTEDQGKYANCQAICTQINSESPTTSDRVVSLANNLNYCDKNCDDYLACYVDTAGCIISCSASGASCS
ncbi:MAG: hypothetical protein J7K73_03720 [Nanoarchaeota archaeon]|nr:hypothetical protein [Nanoarchaeota archaeon]